jgi:TPR repeat protein
MRKAFSLVLFLCVAQTYGEPENIAAIRKKAEGGEVKSQSLLGSHYYLDLADGVEAQKQAVKWLRAAGDQGHAQSQYFLGRIFATGCPEKYFHKNDEEAVKWWSRAAANGYLEAFNALGEAYFEGKGVPRDHRLAFRWYLKAGKRGDYQAQHHLGEQYRLGQGVAKDFIKAHAWYELSIRCIPKWQRERLGVRSPAEVDREALAQKMTMEQTKEAQKFVQVLLKRIQANQEETEPGREP